MVMSTLLQMDFPDLGEAAQQFVDAFYQTLSNQKARAGITSFYIKPTLASPQRPDITLNGNVISDPSEVQKIFENQIPKAQYEVQSFDCHVINPNYNVGLDDAALSPEKDGKKMSIVVGVFLLAPSCRFFFLDEAMLSPRSTGDGQRRCKIFQERSG
jgi:NTF2-related export protein 1/2